MDLNLFLQIAEYNKNIILCVNLMDEARKKGIEIDLERLSKILGVCVVGTSARRKEGIKELKSALENVSLCTYKCQINKNESEEEKIKKSLHCATQIANAVITEKENYKLKRDEKIDRIFTGKLLAFPTMLIFLSLLLFITITLANYPSQLLSQLFSFMENGVYDLMRSWYLPSWVCGLVCEGLIRVVGWIISVMLPPMAIFFPLFTLLEDWGYLPRIAFNLDRPFCKCGTCGKQALTMCMGLGCNAVGVTGCRIIDSPKERKIGILTNSLIPCNGRFPTLIMLISVFFVGGGMLFGLLGAIVLAGVLVCGVIITLLITLVLSKVIKGEGGGFILEMPSYRCAQLGKTLVRSIFDRTLFVLGRALVIAAPAGVMIWLLSNLTVGEMSVLGHIANFLNPVARPFGFDGVILLAFILGLPANEIVIPIALMAYTQGKALVDISDYGTIENIFRLNGWTMLTAICVLVFTMFHSPCLTTLATVKKETGSVKCTLLAAMIPTVIGLLLCFVINTIYTLAL